MRPNDIPLRSVVPRHLARQIIRSHRRGGVVYITCCPGYRMRSRVIKADLIDDLVLTCPNCRKPNRLIRTDTQFNCRGCGAAFGNPFPEKGWKPYMRTAIAAVATGLLIVTFLPRWFSTSDGIAAPPQSLPAARTVPFKNNNILAESPSYGSGEGQMYVQNGTRRNAVVKLIDTKSESRLVSVAISATNKAYIPGIPNGNYTVMFAFGDEIFEDTDRFANPNGFAKFVEPITFSSLTADGRPKLDECSVTLQPVIGGHARTAPIDKSEFERY